MSWHPLSSARSSASSASSAAAGSGRDRPVWAQLAEDQYGVVTREQLLDLGLTPRRVSWLVTSGRFQQLHRGVYATFTGPLPPRTRLSAAVLHAGAGAALGGRSALALHGVVPAAPQLIDLLVPAERRVTATPGLVVASRCRLPSLVQTAPWPPRLRVEEAVLDVTDGSTSPAEVLTLVLSAVQRRRTSPSRLREALGRRPRHRWRRLLGEVLTDAADGVHSMLERRYLRGVERPHGLPRATRQHRNRVRQGNRYRDLRYEQWRVVVELDGEIAHPPEQKQQDDARNREIVLAGDLPMVYGWLEVVGWRCRVAAQVGALLTARGWAGPLLRCGPGCTPDA